MLDKKIKQCSLNVKDVDGKKGIVQFYASTFGTSSKDKDSDGDVIVKGAYSKTLKENKSRIKHLKNHDIWQVPGVITEAVEDNYGLLITSQLAKGSDGSFTTLAKDTLIEYEAGVISEHSVGFKAIKEDYDEQEEANFIKEIKLWEVSSLTGWGANKNTPVVGVKSMKDLAYQVESIDKILRSSQISPDGAVKLLNRLTRMKKYIKSLEAKKKPGSTTSNAQEPIDYDFLTKNLNF